MIINRDILLAMQKGVKTKEIEALAEMANGNFNKEQIANKLKTSKSLSINDVDIKNTKNLTQKVDEVSPDAIKALLSGKKPKQIMKEGNAFLKEDGIKLKNNITLDNSNVKLTNENITMDKNEESNIRTAVYEIIGEILGISNEKLKNEEYIKDKISEVYNFIKLKDSLNKK